MSSNQNANITKSNRGWETVPPSANFYQANNQRRLPDPSTQNKVLGIVNDTKQLGSQPNTGSGPTENGSHHPPKEQNTTVSQRDAPMTLPVLKSVLSADAQEFVPQAKRNGFGSGDSYIVDDLSSLSLQDSSGQSAATDPICERFTNALYVLNYNPGNMEDYLRPICDMIKKRNSETTEEVMNKMVESLFEQSIMEPNFRYTGARICQYLSKNSKSNTYFSGFHKALMRRCQKEYERREELIGSTTADQKRLRGLAMFMAEIFLNVQIEDTEGNVSRLHYLPTVLTDFVHTLLSHPTEEEVKCCCQLLKLSGALIEDVAKNEPKLCTQFEDIFTQLVILKTRTELSATTKILAGSVIQLKEQNWNRSSAVSPPKRGFSSQPETTPFQPQEPVFYNTMGVPCSRVEANLPEEELGEDGAYVLNEEEEAAFLAWQEEEGLTDDQSPWSFNDTGYDSYQLEDNSDEGGMGDEVEAAYEEFLQEQNHNNNVSSSRSANNAHHPAMSSHHYRPHHHTTQQMPATAPYMYQPYSQAQHSAVSIPDYNGFPADVTPMMHPNFLPQGQPQMQRPQRYQMQPSQQQQQQQQQHPSHGYPYYHQPPYQ